MRKYGIPTSFYLPQEQYEFLTAFGARERSSVIRALIDWLREQHGMPPVTDDSIDVYLPGGRRAAMFESDR